MVRNCLLLCFAFCLVGPDALYSQTTWELGPYFKVNWASQTFFNPANTDNETYSFDGFLTFGGGIFGSYHVNERYTLSSRIGYIRKGNVDDGGALFSGPGPFSSPGNFKNSFDFLNLDFVGYYRLSKKSLSPVIGLGLQNVFLLDHRLGSDIPPFNQTYPFDRFEPISSYGLAYLVAIGINKSDAFSLLLEFNRDILPVIKNESLRVRNILFALQLNVPLLGK